MNWSLIRSLNAVICIAHTKITTNKSMFYFCPMTLILLGTINGSIMQFSTANQTLVIPLEL